MPAPPAPKFDQSIRALTRGLADARDSQLTDAVALLDTLPQRGLADGLIEPLRKRIAGLRPRRPLTLCRLLFSPFDPVIVPAAHWRGNAATIPRTVLVPLAETLRGAMGQAAQSVDTLIKGRSIQDADVVDQAGAILWPEAGRILSTVPPPLGWGHTGLNISAYPPLARRIGAVLFHLDALDILAMDAALGRAPPDAERVIAILSATLAQEPEALPMMTTLLLARLPQAGQALADANSALGPRGEAMLRASADQAVELLLDQLATPGTMAIQLGRGDLAQSADMVRRIGLLLRQAETTGSTDGYTRLKTLRRRLNETCRERFAAGLETELTNKLIEPRTPPDAAEVDRLEAAARGLRAFAAEARDPGTSSSDHYETLLRRAADTVRALSPSGTLGLIERIRLVEILDGPDAALTMLGR